MCICLGIHTFHPLCLCPDDMERPDRVVIIKDTCELETFEWVRAAGRSKLDTCLLGTAYGTADVELPLILDCHDGAMLGSCQTGFWLG
jgi:hypothetical protein